MTLSGFQPIAPLVDVTYEGLLIQGTEQSVEIAQAIEQAYVAGAIDSGVTKMENYPSGAPGWTVQLTIDGVLCVGYQYDWLVQGSDNSLRIFAGTSQWPGINAQIAGKFTTNTPLIWAATAPAATATVGGAASIVFPEPTSANAPFTYTVTQTDATTGDTSAATLSGEPVVSGGNVTLTVTGLTEGDQVTFQVVVATQYDGVTATSLATALITAT